MISAMKNIAFVNYAELICCSPHPRHRRRCLAGVIMTMIVVTLFDSLNCFCAVNWGLLCDARHLHLC